MTNVRYSPRIQGFDLIELRPQDAHHPAEHTAEKAPATTQRTASPATCPATSRGAAPSAMRTPMSRQGIRHRAGSP